MKKIICSLVFIPLLLLTLVACGNPQKYTETALTDGQTWYVSSTESSNDDSVFFTFNKDHTVVINNNSYRESGTFTVSKDGKNIKITTEENDKVNINIKKFESKSKFQGSLTGDSEKDNLVFSSKR